MGTFALITSVALTEATFYSPNDIGGSQISSQVFLSNCRA
jgi:hypothetical protein